MKTEQSTLNENDRNFITAAAQGGAAEVKLSQLVQGRAKCEEVMQFGQRMVQDHTQANRELMQLASRKGAPPNPELDSKHQKLFERLSGLSGENFDREYINAMVEDHKEVISKFDQETAQGHDQDLTNWASKTVPKLREHLKMAQSIASQH